jgi:hypothetical protein
MENKQQILIKPKSKKKDLVIGSIIATLIAMTPYFFYIYESVPDTKSWHTFFFTYNANHYQSAYVAMWVLTGKLIPLYMLFLWFFTCRHWWYHTLLVPIAMYSYQVFDVINKDAQFVDANQLIYLIPIMTVIIPSIYLIRAKIFNKINEANKSLEELEDEFKISPKNFWEKISQYF